MKMSTTPQSIALSKDLKARGWTFVGPTTCYAFMQAMGLVNDHVEGCDVRAEIERAPHPVSASSLSWGQAARFSESLSWGWPSTSDPIALPESKVSKIASSGACDRRRNFDELAGHRANCVDFPALTLGPWFVSNPGMARRHRIVFCGAIYHVMARGNRKLPIFVDDVDRRRFLAILAIALEKFGAECFAYCLMGNHFHLVMHTPHANLPNVMHHIDGLYAQFVNWRHHLTGHLLDGPYKAIVIDDTAYLRNTIGYVLRNPVAAGLVNDAAHWQWSSYNATKGKARPKFLTLTWLTQIFEADDP